MAASTHTRSADEQTPSVQKAFFKNVQALVSVLEDMGSPFTEDSTELNVLDTKEIMPECVVQAIKTAKHKGQSQYDQFQCGREVS